MNDIELEVSPPFATIQVDRRLDLVRAYDLRRAVVTALRLGCRHISLDLSRVPAADAEGVTAVLWCSEHTVANGGTLNVEKLSGPLHVVVALHNLGHRECGCAVAGSGRRDSCA